jgi:cell wall-associated NlpC family hydrolase
MASTQIRRSKGRILSAAVFTGALLGGCSSAPISRPGGASDAHHLATVAVPRQHVVRAAAQTIGTPYRWGGASPKGFDCSGLVQYAHRQAGFEVPRTTAAQWRHAATPHRGHLLPGDLLFFSLGGRKDRHVGIYEGGGTFIHAPSSGKRVGRASLDNPYWRSRLVGTKSFL